MRTGVVADRRYMDHSMGAYHVESPARVEVINRMVAEDPPAPLLPVEPRPATREELLAVHERGYLDLLASTAGRDGVFLDADATTGPKTYETALLAAGGFLRSLELIMEGKIRSAFAAVRPPGHHAEASRAMGFCFLNNVALGAEFLIRKHGLRRVLIVDWDLHHGNGTEHAFYSRRDVLYFSTHQVPLYPGSGAVRDMGHGEGLGYNLNVPLMAGKGDDDYLGVFRKILAPVADRFEPEFVLVSAGFDIGAGDPLGGMAVTPRGFGKMTAALRALAERSAGGRLAVVLEGGYNLAALRDGAREVLASLAAPRSPALPEPAVPEATRVELDYALRAFRKVWDIPDP